MQKALIVYFSRTGYTHTNGNMYCCANCARMEGVQQAVDRI
jgi:hypothetical protein